MMPQVPEQNAHKCPNCGKKWTDDADEWRTHSYMCEYAAGLRGEVDWLKREADAADKRAERAEAALREIANPAYPCVAIDVAREALGAGDE